MTELRLPIVDLARIQGLVNLLSPSDEPGAALHDAIDTAADALRDAAAHGMGGVATLAQLAASLRAPAMTAPSPDAAAGSADADQVTAAFEQQFASLAADKGEFDAFMQQVFGDDYDCELAEQYRQQALAGDFSWLPEVQFVDSEVLGGANGAYNAEDGVVYISSDLAASDPAAAAQTFVEEAGHHLDATLNSADSRGDEGELFRRTLGGESLSASEVAAIRAEDDTGTIVVDGKEIAVEFWNPFKAAADAVKSVGEAIGDVASGAWEGVKEVADGVVDAAVDVGMGVYDMTAGFATNLVKGNFGEACASVVRGFDRAVFQSVERFWVGGLYGVQAAVDGVTDALGPLGKPIRAITDRVFDIGFTQIDSAFTIFREGARLIPDMVTGLVGDVERAVELAADGRWGAAAGQLAMAGVNLATAPLASVFDMGVVWLQGVASGVQTALFLEPPGRRLTDAEVDYLKSVYGHSIDYGLIRIKQGGALNNLWSAHTIGNTVYLPKSAFNADGSWAEGELEYYLAHEVGHVWQNQNGGADYIHRAFGAQILAALQGDMMDAYGWQADLAAGKTFETMDPEAQAEVINDLALALLDDVIDSNDAADLTGTHYSQAEIDFLNEVARKLGWGTGAG